MNAFRRIFPLQFAQRLKKHWRTLILRYMVGGMSREALSVRVRSAVFRVAFPLWTVIISLLCQPYKLCKRSKDTAPAGKAWAAGLHFLLKYVGGVRYEIRGENHLPVGTPVIFACQHQSVWETAIFLTLFTHPAYVLKKELLKVPLFGPYLQKMEMISIDRSGGSSAVKRMQADVRDRLAQGRSVVIFPEGTRRPVDAPPEYQPGVAFLYAGAPENIPVIPVSLNSGRYWTPFSKYLRPGTIVMEYREAIPAGLPRKEFMRLLQERMEMPVDAA